MRFVATALFCVGVLLTVTGCDPVTNNHYFTQGVGTSLYPEDIAAQTALQDAYVAEICKQADLASVSLPDGGASSCGDDPRNWWLFVQAGMNDIDQRCDGYLTWLDNVRRSEAPILKQISDTQTASTLIMQATGAGAGPIAIVAAAFGLATNTFTNVTSRLILEVNHSTVQAVVLTRQTKFRLELLGKTKKSPTPILIANRPAAIFALRSYLRLCMPITIETEINNTVTLFERGGTTALDNKQSMISATSVGPVGSVRAPPRIFTNDDATKALRNWLRPGGVTDTMRLKIVDDFLAEKKLNPKPLVSEFLKTREFAAERLELARRLKLVP